MLKDKQKRHIEDRLSNIRARLSGLKQYVTALQGSDMQAADILNRLDAMGCSLRKAECVASRTPQQRVADRIKARLDAHTAIEDHRESLKGIPYEWPTDTLKTAWDIASHWPWNATNHNWWALKGRVQP